MYTATTPISTVSAPISSGLAARELRRRGFIGSPPSRHLTGVAAELAVVGEGRRAVGRRGRRPRAWATAQFARVQTLEAFLRRGRGQRVVGADFEVVEHGADARVLAVGVVVAGARAEGAHEALEVGGVGPEERGHRHRFLQRFDVAGGAIDEL